MGFYNSKPFYNKFFDMLVTEVKRVKIERMNN